MKTIAIGISLLAAILGFSFSQSKCSGTKTKTVSAASITKLSPGKTLEIDLRRKGTVYKFNDSDTDFSRVTLRTADGVKSFSELLKTSNTSVKGGLVLGALDDMRNHLPSTTSTTNFDCGVICKCTGALDCLSMIGQGKCGGAAWCNTDPDISSCYCVAKP